MIISKYISILLSIFYLFNPSCLFAQTSNITGTNLNIKLEHEFVVDENSATISNQDCSISFIEMAGVNYFDQAKDFHNIEEEYAKQGIEVNEKLSGKLNEYEAFFIKLDIKPSMYQIFFGDSLFCALVNVIANDTINDIDEEEVNSMLHSIKYEESTISALEEHANFEFVEENDDWEFISYQANIFGFENKTSEDALMIIQLPPETSVLASKESLADQFVTRFQADMPNLEVIEEGIQKTKDKELFRKLLDVSKDGNGNIALIYISIFNNSKSTFVVQGLGKKKDAATIAKYDSLVNNIKTDE